ncbi:hypothetical protein ACYX79_01680 [Stenotrophomonas rhizophila]
MAERTTSNEWIRWAMLLIFVAMLFGIPNSSPWFGLVFVYLIAAGLFIVGSMLWTALRSQRAAAALRRTPPTRALQTREVRALEWFGQPERIAWRMPRGNAIDLAGAAQAAGRRPVVRTLRGPYRVMVRGQHHERHDFIGKVEVLMLPGADRYVRGENEADVLLCGKFAVVLALNGAWRIDQAPSLLR